MAATRPKLPSLSALPPELIEEILVQAVSDGNSEAVAALARTCKCLRDLIYEPVDRHLWRSLFLASFDDPRALRFQQDHTDCNWQKEFQDRSWCHRYLRKNFVSHKHHTRKGGIGRADLRDAAACARAVRVLFRVIQTSAPSPQPVNVHRPALVKADRDNHGQPVPLMELHSQSALWPPHFPAGRLSANIAWLEKTLSNGLPSLLMNYCADPMLLVIGWHDAPEIFALTQVLSHVGLITTPAAQPDAPAAPRYNLRHREAGPTAADTPPAHALLWDTLVEEEQRQRAWYCARQHVFNMEYLTRSRHWGPFLPVASHQETPELENDYVDDDDDDDVEDRDYIPPDDAAALLADWAWLGAARIVAECTLRAHAATGNIRKLERWDNLREGFWVPAEDDGVVDEVDLTASVGLDAQGGGEGSPKSPHERDWAGVEGVWRYVYRHRWCASTDHFAGPGALRRLEFHNFDDPALEEAWIIVPLSLRITGYSPCPIAKYAERPTIHVEGEMGGAGWVGDGEQGADDARKVYGTVSMLADGNVRWSITNLDEDNVDDEWVSEAIQLGGVGSAMGSLGMWTGARHEEDDPLGVIWQWRVG
ncbi:hypothetical protein BD413DRAFT_596809 [Trametes elegans]|nr:hypothetical protein BD413DRAFT_596809 [Trametes elegans]